MSLYDKLKPPTKRPVGKATECPKCKGPGEYFTANYIACKRCDAPKPKAAYVDPALEAACARDLEIEFDDEDTNPGFSMYHPMSRAGYRCLACSVQTKTDPDDVANGTRCFCGGVLKVLP
jgi:hypothetical protein